MPVTMTDTLLADLLADPVAGGQLFGRVRDGGDVLQIAGRDAATGAPLGRWARDLPADTVADTPLLLLITPDAAPRALRAESGAWRPEELSIIRPHADFARRIQGLFDTTALADATVAIVGLGSGGAAVAAQLARCGVGLLRLVDFDRLEVHNLARHICGMSDVGRYKTRAVRDLLLDVSPFLQVETFELDVLADAEALTHIVTGCDLVVAATDGEAAKLAINAACWPRGIPATYGAAYNRALGGDVFRAIPPDGPCYACLHAILGEFFGPPPTASTDFTPAYADPERMADMVAGPGLSIDVGMIALLLARVSLHTLLRGQSSTLPGLPTDWTLFGNRAEWIFEKPLESIFVEVPKRPDCPTCNYAAYTQAHLAMSPEEAEREGRQILAAIKPFTRVQPDDHAEGDDGRAR